MKNAYLITAKITVDINNFSNFFMLRKSWSILCILDAPFVVWLM